LEEEEEVCNAKRGEKLCGKKWEDESNVPKRVSDIKGKDKKKPEENLSERKLVPIYHRDI